MAYFIRFGDLPSSGKSLCYAEEAIWEHCERAGYPLYQADGDDERNVRLEASGCTQRFVDGRLCEAGISVCYAELIDDDDLYEFDTHSYSRREFREMFADLPAYLVKGLRVGTGFSDEPLLEEVRIISPVQIDWTKLTARSI